jgi:hypothetical protein
MTLYETKHEGTAIVCGSAPCVFEDLDKALKLRPNATILSVNATFGLFPDLKIEHTWTQHNEWALELKELIGDRNIKIHARSNIMGAGVDYHWPSLDWVCGSSGVSGAMWAKNGMGFDEVIMVGIPLSPDQTKYAPEYPASTKEDHFFAKSSLISHWLVHLNTHVENGKTNGVFSMSGETSKILGVPS